MADRTTLAINVLTAGLGLVGLFLLAGWILPSKYRFSAADIRRWFAAGWKALQPILPALGVLLALSAANELIRLQGWVLRQSSGPVSLSISDRTHMALHASKIARGLLEGWTTVAPFPGIWILGFWPLLLTSAARGRFPFSTRRSVSRFWLLVGFLAIAGWLFGHWTFLGSPPTLNSPIRLAVNVFQVGVSVFGYSSFLLLLIANVDPDAENFLSRVAQAPARALTRLAYLRIVILASSSAFVTLVLYLQSRHPGSPVSSSGIVEWTCRVLGAAVCSLAVTALLPASSSKSESLALQRTTRWWRSDGTFLATLVIAAGAAKWLLWLPVEIFLPIPWGQGSGPKAQLQVALHSLLGSIEAFGLNLLGFCLLLGNWLEAREKLKAKDPGLDPA